MSDKRNADIKKLENWLTQANELKADLENKADAMAICINKLRENYPDLPPAKTVDDVEEYSLLNTYISAVTKAIEKLKNNNK
jgi:hypothetical protein